MCLASERPNFYIDLDYRILHEDEELLVVDKPAPLAVHPVGSYRELNLHSLLKKDARWAGCRLRLTHRLDAETSGVLVIAKTEEAARGVGMSFLKGQVAKKYRALVFGVPAEKEGFIDARLGYDKSSGFQTVRIRDDEAGETAFTRYRVLSTHGDYASLEIEPLTGRTHQIRAHLALAGHPIVGDKIYIDLNIFRRYVLGGLDEDMLQTIKLPRLALHASSIEFKHPRTHETIRFVSEVPDLLKGWLN